MDHDSITSIRAQEAQSHIAQYSSAKLYEQGSWLQKPVKTILDILPYFSSYDDIRILDLGCGVGRNSIAIARFFQDRDCMIDCVDILVFAIRRLLEYAKEYSVLPLIRPYHSPIDDFPIPPESYHWILAVSALEHMDSETTFRSKLEQIRDGICENGIVSLILNSEVAEWDKVSGAPRTAQFEVNLPTQRLVSILKTTFSQWDEQKLTVKEQVYEIPREHGSSILRSNVVTFVAKK